MDPNKIQEIDAREFPGRPTQLDDLTSSIKDITAGVEKTNRGVENFKKNTWGLWSLVAAVLYGAYKLGVFAEVYNTNAVYGSPALLKFQGEVKAEIAAIKQTDDSRYEKMNEILRAQQGLNTLLSQRVDQAEKRIERLEDRK